MHFSALSLPFPHAAVTAHTAPAVDQLVKQAKMQQHKPCENIPIAHGPDVSWKAFPHPLVGRSEQTCKKKIKPPEVNKERSKRQQTNEPFLQVN